MSDPVTEDALHRALLESQRSGFLGERSIAEVIDHARVFVEAVDHVGIDDVVDLGSGGGVPGLVIGADLPVTRLTLVDRRAKRTDFLERIVRRLGWSDRVEVCCADADAVATSRAGQYDAVVARGFGPPEITLRLGVRLTRPGGRVVISEPPDGDRWDPDLLGELDVEAEHLVREAGRVVVFHVSAL